MDIWLIAKTGEQVNCSGGTHDITCRLKFKKSLSRFLKSGGVRVKIRNDNMVIEFYEPITAKQNRVINRLLKYQEIYVIILPFQTITKFRPIKNFVFDDTLVRK